ncbi:MAG: PEGA domain-containing protein [Ignavibacterium sp.]|nr:PEGA domain-containing protein [Ignavibacterium sp.]
MTILLSISCDKEISRSPVEPEPNEGNIKISSNPSGFKVYFNGRNTGAITPDSLLYLDAGSYEVSLKKKYYKDSVFSIQIGEDTKLDLSIDFTQNESMFGKLNIQSTPSGAAIWLNDSLLQQTTPYTIQNLLPGEYSIKLTYPQHRDGLLSATVSSGITGTYSKILADTSVWVDFQIYNSELVSNNLSCIAIDHFGYKWIGTLDKGLMKFDGLNVLNFKKSNSGIPGDRIFTISIDILNRVWVGTNEGIGIYDGSSWTIYNKNNSGLTSNEITSIKFGNDNIVWIGAYTGLYKLNGTTWTRYNDFMNTIWVNDLEVDNGNIWMATNNGIIRLTVGAIEYFPDSIYNYPSNIVSSVEKDKINNIWFCHLNTPGARNGISNYNGNVFTKYYPGTSLNAMNHITIDEQDNKWIGTNEGLFRFDSNNIQSVYSRANTPITSDRISCTAIDHDGVLWITTFSNGLNKFKFSSI